MIFQFYRMKFQTFKKWREILDTTRSKKLRSTGISIIKFDLSSFIFDSIGSKNFEGTKFSDEISNMEIFRLFTIPQTKIKIRNLILDHIVIGRDEISK